jgi:hypothetical protein
VQIAQYNHTNQTQSFVFFQKIVQQQGQIQLVHQAAWAVQQDGAQPKYIP